MQIQPLSKYPFILLLLLLFAETTGAVYASDTTRINRLLEQSRTLQRSDADSCYVLASESYRLSLQAHYPEGIAGSFIRMGSVLMTRGYNDSAMPFIRTALDISKTRNNPYRISSSYILLSYIYQYKGWYDSSFSALYEAMRYSASAHDTVNLIQVHMTLADLKYNYNDFSGAAKAYLEVIRLAALSHYTDVSGAYIGLGNTLYKKQRVREALHYYLRADSLTRLLNDQVSMLQNLNNIALCYTGLKENDRARYYYESALKGYTGQGMQSETGNTYYNLGSMYVASGEAEPAIASFQKALDISSRLHEQQRVAECFLALSNAYALKGDFIRAYHYHEDYTRLKDSLLNSEKISSISEMQARYETEKKEQQIKLLGAQRKTNIAQRNLFIAGSVILLLGLFILGFYYIQKQKLAKQKEELAKKQVDELLNTQEIKTFNAVVAGQEEERQRIAGDLHDRLGSMLATVKVLFSGLENKIDQTREEGTRQYEKTGALLDEACSEVRRISHNMSSSMVMSFGLPMALNELCDSIEASGLIRCRLQVYGEESRPGQQLEISCYRIVQELMSNILKHAAAKQVQIQLNYSAGLLIITVEDDGVGFDVESKRRAGGMGLQNVENRARKLNGTCHVESAPGKGTMTIIEIPLTQESI